MLNLQTLFGEVDLAFTPAAITGYDELEASAVTRNVGLVAVRVAALSDVIRSKEAAGRDKDNNALPELYQLAGRPASTTSPEGTHAPPARPPAELTLSERSQAARQRIEAARRAAQTARRSKPPKPDGPQR